MPGDNIIVKIFNQYPNTIYINDEPIAEDANHCYQLHLPLIQASYVDNTIHIILDGEHINEITPSKGMCFCLTPNTAISITFTESMQVTVNNGTNVVGDDGLPGGVRCGE